MTKIGIGIVTYNRLDYLKRAVSAVKAHTRSNYELLIADDGSTDGTAEWCKAEGLRLITGPNGGVCWNKNRALFGLQELGCDPILLLEDDCVPIQDAWDWEWRIGTALFGHLAYAHPKLDPWCAGGSGTALDPFINTKATAQCSSVSGLALAEVGFLDSRFKGYGVGHAEWTSRLKKAGFGFKPIVDQDGRNHKANLYIRGGLKADDAPTFKDSANIKRNEELFEKLKAEPNYREPWSSSEEYTKFKREADESGIGTGRHKRLTVDRSGNLPEIAVRNLKPYGEALKKVFSERKSFLRSSGWLSSMAVGVPTYNNEIIPWMNYTIVNFLRERIKSNWKVFEFGAGYSTLWWSSRVESIKSVEHDAEWAGLVRELCRGKPVEIEHRATGPAFSEGIDAAGGPFDVIVVDGHDRPNCLRRSVRHLTATGVLLLDNSNRPEYASVIDEIKQQGFKEIRLKGPAPMTFQEESTSIFYRPANCLDL